MSLIGVCENFCGGPAEVMPFMANGSVLDYLRRERKSLVLGAVAENRCIVCISGFLLGPKRMVLHHLVNYSTIWMWGI